MEIAQIHQKWDFKNSWNWLGSGYACNSLTNFEYDLHAMEIILICLKTFVKSIQENLFSADFSHSKPLSVKRGVESENSGKETLSESGQKFVGNW